MKAAEYLNRWLISLALPEQPGFYLATTRLLVPVHSGVEILTQ